MVDTLKELGLNGTMIWTVELGGRSFGIWQEYALLFALPASLLAFLLGEWLGRAAPPRFEAETPGVRAGAGGRESARIGRSKGGRR